MAASNANAPLSEIPAYNAMARKVFRIEHKVLKATGNKNMRKAKKRDFDRTALGPIS